MKIAPKLCASDTHLLLLDRYETTYGICDHVAVGASRPLALVAMHDAEDSTSGGLLYERIEQYQIKQVSKHFGISLTEFLNFPRDICLKILELSSKQVNAEGAMAENILNRIENKART